MIRKKYFRKDGYSAIAYDKWPATRSFPTICPIDTGCSPRGIQRQSAKLADHVYAVQIKECMEMQRHSFYVWLAWNLIKKIGKIITSPRARWPARESSNSPPLSTKNKNYFCYIFAFHYDTNHIHGQPNLFFYCILLQEIAYWNANYIEFLQGLLHLLTQYPLTITTVLEAAVEELLTNRVL